MSNPVAILREITDGDKKYNIIMFWCPGCEVRDDGLESVMSGGLHMLAVSGDATDHPVWGFDGNLQKPTLTPSIKTSIPDPSGIPGKPPLFVCHSFLKAGVFQFLNDSTHKYKGKKVPMVPLPDWVLDE